MYAVLLLLFFGAGSEIPSLSPPIADLRAKQVHDTFNEVHNGHSHEAIDILAPRGTPVHAVVSGVIRKLFLSKPGAAGSVYSKLRSFAFAA